MIMKKIACRHADKDKLYTQIADATKTFQTLK